MITILEIMITEIINHNITMILKTDMTIKIGNKITEAKHK